MFLASTDPQPLTPKAALQLPQLPHPLWDAAAMGRSTLKQDAQGDVVIPASKDSSALF